MGKAMAASVAAVVLVILIWGEAGILVFSALAIPFAIALWIVGNALGWFKR